MFHQIRRCDIDILQIFHLSSFGHLRRSYLLSKLQKPSFKLQESAHFSDGLECSTLFQQKSLPYQAPSLNSAARPSLLMQPFVLRQPCDAKLSNPTVQLLEKTSSGVSIPHAPSLLALPKLKIHIRKGDSSRDPNVPGRQIKRFYQAIIKLFNFKLIFLGGVFSLSSVRNASLPRKESRHEDKMLELLLCSYSSFSITAGALIVRVFKKSSPSPPYL